MDFKTTVIIQDDFDLEKIVFSGQCFRPAREEDGKTYRFICGNNILYIRKTNTSSTDISEDNPESYDISCSIEEWNMFWQKYFDMDTCYSRIRKEIVPSDHYLTKAAQKGKGIRILRQDKFEMLISFIISQRKSIPAIRSSVEKLCLKYGKKIENSDFFAFPTPLELSKATSDELKDCGLGYRVPYIMDAVKRVLDGRLDLDKIDALSDDDLFNALTEVYGVGTKVANCISLFAYHRIGRAPVDTWINKVITEEYAGESPFPLYPETAGVIQQYMFYYAQHLKSN